MAKTLSIGSTGRCAAYFIRPRMILVTHTFVSGGTNLWFKQLKAECFLFFFPSNFRWLSHQTKIETRTNERINRLQTTFMSSDVSRLHHPCRCNFPIRLCDWFESKKRKTFEFPLITANSNDSNNCPRHLISKYSGNRSNNHMMLDATNSTFLESFDEGAHLRYSMITSVILRWVVFLGT